MPSLLGSSSSSRPRAQGRAFPLAVLLACASAFAACNSIFGVEPGELAGGASSSVTTTGTGGAGGQPDATSTGGGGATGTGGSTSSAGGAGGSGGTGLVCDGAGSVAGHSVAHAERNGGESVEQGIAALLKSDGTVIVSGTFRDANTKFGGHTLDWPTPANGQDEYQDIFLARYTPLGNSVEWASPFGGPLDQQPSAMTMDGSRNIYVSGFMQGTLTFGDTTLVADASLHPYSYDGFVAKLDENGNPQWARRFGGAENDVARAIASTWDGVFVVGATNAGITPGGTTFHFGEEATEPFGTMASQLGHSGLFLAKLDLDGNLLFHRIFDVNTDFAELADPGEPFAMTVGGDGYLYLAGGARGSGNSFGGPTLNDYGSRDIFIAKLDPGDGSLVWASSYGDSNDQAVSAVALDACGNIVIAGNYTGSVKLGDTVLSAPDAPDEQHIFIAKLAQSAPDGSLPLSVLWAHSYSAQGTQEITAIAVDDHSDIAVVGNLFDSPASTGIDLGTGVLVGAQVGGHPSDRPDGFVMKLDGGGATSWAERYNGPGDETARGVAVDYQGHMVVTGDVDDTYDFGTGDLVSNYEDMYFVVYSP